VVDIFRYTDVAEAGVAILNPLSDEKLRLVGELARLTPGQSVLDLACGKGELLCQFAARHGIRGIGVDIHPPFVSIASARAEELGVSSAVSFVQGDAGIHEAPGSFDVVSCIGATWIGGGFGGALSLMRRSLSPGGTLLVGEVFFESPPPSPDAVSSVIGREGGTDLGGLLSMVESAGCTLDEMVLASRDDWDRYSSRQWDRAESWLRAHPDDGDAPGIREWVDRSRRSYLADERSWMGWGVFVIRERGRS
jgi:SAM-dependent methyltransferase